MQRVQPTQPWPLHGAAASRRIEQAAQAVLPPHTLMQRAGLAVARLALALAPHARTVWIACGPGNNGGDGLEAAMHLQRWGANPWVTWAGTPATLPPDAAASLARARDAGVPLRDAPPPQWDLAVDALLGIGASRGLSGPMADWAARMNASGAPVLAVDVPSGLDADTGRWVSDAPSPGVRATHTLSLLSLKPGLYTAHGRDAAGEIWWDDLGVDAASEPPSAWLNAAPPRTARPHAAHKGSQGDVAVIGGAPGMAGAALLAASAALHAGAGRVYVGALDTALPADPTQPELMLRAWDALDLSAMSVACGCGGGEAVRAVLPRVLGTARALVLDADALNAIAADTALQSLVAARGARGKPTVMTPHPLEAARLLGRDTATVQADRLAAAQALAARYRAVVVLKGSGSVIAAPDAVPWINPTGNGRLATAGTGDVLAGLIAASMAGATALAPLEAARAAVFEHGALADAWPADEALTAGALARRIHT